MSTGSQDTDNLEREIHEIRQLEERIASLKRNLISTGSTSRMSFGNKDTKVPFLIVESQKRSFALPVELVDEVFEMVAVTELPEAKPGVVGLLDYHGDMIVLFDLAEMAGMDKTPIDPNLTVVLCTTHHVRFALMVSAVADVITAHGHEIATGNEIMTGIFKEVGLIRTSHGAASIVDVWTAILSSQVDWVMKGETSDVEEKTSPPENDY